jgi:hypothetical protein
MITGFNTNVKYGDTTYHVQTEDRGINNPLIESLIYVKGAIVDSHRTPYRHLLQSENFRDSILQRILDFQHQQIVSAIKKGQFQKGMELQPFVDGNFTFQFSTSKKIEIDRAKIPDKAKLSEQQVEPKPTGLAFSNKLPNSKVLDEQDTQDSLAVVEAICAEPLHAPKSETVSSPFTMEYTDRTWPIEPQAEQGIEIRVESSRNFIAGSHVDLSLIIESRQSKTRLENVQVVIKVIGTSLMPRLYTGKTDKQGKLVVSFNLPSYSVGSAALIIQASTSLGNSEIKYLIHKR